MSQAKGASPSADTIRIRAKISAEEVGGGYTSFCMYFLSEKHMNAEVAKRSAWSVMEWTEVAL